MRDLSKFPAWKVARANAGMIAFRLGNVHVGCSFLQAARQALDGVFHQVRALPRMHRRCVLAVVRGEHRRNQRLYNFVMRGGAR